MKISFANNFVIILLISSTGFLSFIYQKVLGFETSGNVVYYINWIMIYIPIVLKLKLSNKIYGNAIIISLLVFWLLLSTTWSALHIKTLFSALSFMLTVLSAIAIAQNHNSEKFLILLKKTFFILVIFSCLFLIFLPDLMFDTLGFSSIFLHKNHAGFFYAVSSVLFLNEILINKVKNISYYLVFALSSFLCAYSLSMLGIIVYSIGISLIIFRTRAVKNASKLFDYTFLIFIVIFFLLGPGIAVLLGKDPTYSGRTDIWAIGFKMYLETPILGYGYYGFFSDVTNAPSQTFYNYFLYYFAPTFHNGYLERLVDIGAIGLFLCVLLLLNIRKKVIDMVISNRKNLIYLVIFLMSLIENFGEAVLLNYNHFLTVFMIYLLFVRKYRSVSC